MRLRRSLLSDGPHGNCAGLQRGDDQRGYKHDRREARGPSMKYSIIVKKELKEEFLRFCSNFFKDILSSLLCRRYPTANKRRSMRRNVSRKRNGDVPSAGQKGTVQVPSRSVFEAAHLHTGQIQSARIQVESLFHDYSNLRIPIIAYFKENLISDQISFDTSIIGA